MPTPWAPAIASPRRLILGRPADVRWSKRATGSGAWCRPPPTVLAVLARPPRLSPRRSTTFAPARQNKHVSAKLAAVLNALSADQLFEYDDFGVLKTSGLHLDTTTGLQTAGTDRCQSYTTDLWKDTNNVWWSRQKTQIYYTNTPETIMRASTSRC